MNISIIYGFLHQLRYRISDNAISHFARLAISCVFNLYKFMIVLLETLSPFVDMLIVELGLSKNTVAAYSSDVEHFIDFVHAEGAINTALINQYCDYLHQNVSKITLKRKISSIKSWISFCESEFQQKFDIQWPDLGKCSSKMNLVSHNDFNSLKDACCASKFKYADLLSTMIDVLYCTGMRISEMLDLVYADIKSVLHDSSNKITVRGKGSKERIVFITDAVRRSLMQYCEKYAINDGYVWILNGKRISRNQVYNWLAKICKEHCIATISPHALRHRLGSDLIQKNMNIIAIQKLLGHASVHTTEIYTHLQDGMLNDTVMRYHPLSDECVDNNIYKS